MIAVSDSNGGVSNKDGIQVGALRKHKEKKGSVVGFPGTRPISNEDSVEMEVVLSGTCPVKKPNYKNVR